MPAERSESLLAAQLAKAQARISELEAALLRSKSEPGRAEVPLQPPSFILESITDAFVALDRDFRYIWVNAEAERLTGMSRHQLLGSSMWELFPEALGTSLDLKIREALVRQIPVEFENFYPTWNRWFYNKAYPTEEGGVAVYWRETTQEKLAQAELRRQALVLEQVHSSIISTDLDGKIIRWSHGAERMFGYTPEEVLGRHVSLLYFEEDREHVSSRVLEPLLRAGRLEIELRNQRKSGDECYILLSLSLLRDEANRAYGMLGVASDVTAQRKAERALRESEERYRCLADAMPQIAYITGRDGKTQMVNRHWEKYSGIPAEQCLEFNWQSWIHPDDVGPILPRWMECIRTGEFFDMEYRLRNAANEYRWHLSRAVPVHAADGEIEQWVGTLTDIHDRKTAEEALRETEERLRLAFLAAEGMIYDWDPRTGVVQRSPHLKQILGVHLEESEPTAQWWQERIHPDDSAASGSSVLASLNTDQNHFTTEFRARHAEGHWVQLSDRGYVVRDQHGVPIRVVGSTHDITERKLLERELQQINQRLKFQANILSTTDDAVIALDPGNRITYVNAGAERLYGIRALDVIGAPLSTIYRYLWLAPEDESQAQSGLAAHGTWKGENVHVRQDGTRIFVSSTVNVLPREFGGGLVAVIRDISTRKLAEAASQKHATQLARANEDLLHFAYGVSHDLQTPLRTISSFSQLLALKYQEKLDTEGTEFIALIVDASARMVTMLRDLLQFAQVAGGKAPFSASVSMDQVLASALENLRSGIDEAKATVTHDPLPNVTGDAGQLTQVLQNLIGNSLKYRRPDTTPVIHVGVGRDDREWVIAVSDNGIGFSPKYAERIFEVFQRLHGQEFAGTGIGLTICKRIIERHGGRIWATAEPGVGATFSFTIPSENAGTGVATESTAPALEQLRHSRLAPDSPPPAAGHPVFDELFSALDLAPAIVRDLEGRILIWTRGAERLFKFTNADAVGARVHDLLNSAFPAPATEMHAHLLQNGEWTGQVKAETKDGGTIWLASHWALYRDGSGRPQSVIEVHNDITALKSAEAALLRSAEQRDLALRAGHMGVWQWDRRTGAVDWDETIEGFLHMAPGSFERTFEAFQQRVHPDDRERVQGRIAEAFEHGPEYTVEFRMLRADGAYCWLRGQGQVVRDNGQACGMIGVVWDITSRIESVPQ